MEGLIIKNKYHNLICISFLILLGFLVINSYFNIDKLYAKYWSDEGLTWGFFGKDYPEITCENCIIDDFRSDFFFFLTFIIGPSIAYLFLIFILVPFMISEWEKNKTKTLKINNEKKNSPGQPGGDSQGNIDNKKSRGYIKKYDN